MSVDTQFIKANKVLIIYFAHTILSVVSSTIAMGNSSNISVSNKTEQNVSEVINNTLEQPLKLSEDAPRVDIKEVFKSVCARQVDVLCIKLSLILLVDRLASRPSSVEIYPGVSIQQGRGDPNINSTSPTAGRLLVRTAIDSPEMLDEVVLSSIHNYLQSLSLNIHILDNSQLQKFRRFGEEALPSLVSNNQHQNTGRGKNKGYGGVAMAGLITGGSMLALALSGLAAMAGKAMMTALMAMMMALICLLKGQGGGGGGGGHGGKSSHYEVIAHPYFTKEQTHSAEFQTSDQGIYHTHGVGRAFELNRTENGMRGDFETEPEPVVGWPWGTQQSSNPAVDYHEQERFYNFERTGRQSDFPADEILAAVL